MLPKDLPHTSFQHIPPGRPRVRLPGDNNPDPGARFFRFRGDLALEPDPNVEKRPAGENSLVDEAFEGCLFTKPLFRPQPLLLIQRLNLG